MASPRRAALELLTRIDRQGGYSNIVLDSFLSKSGMERRDAAFVTALVYGVAEHALSIDYCLSHFAKRDAAKMHPKLRAILRLGVCQILYMEKVPPSAAVDESVRLARETGQGYASGFVNAVLRRVAENKDNPPLPDPDADPIAYMSIRYSCPRALIEGWVKDYGIEKARGIVGSLGIRPPAAARVNTLRVPAPELCEKLGEEGIAARPAPGFEGAVVLDRAADLRGLDAFRSGLFHMQDFASQLCCLAVGAQPGERVLDICAAPGGKSFTLCIRMEGQGSVTACDLYENWLELIREGAKRLGLGKMVSVVLNDASKPNDALGLYDRVLCDAPCSGLGVIRRKPEIRYKNPETFDLLPDLQYSILMEAARHVKPGGRLVYSTCTLRRAENEEIAQQFLNEHPEFTPGPLPDALPVRPQGHTVTLFPQESGTDGFFIACFQKFQVPAKPDQIQTESRPRRHGWST